MEHGDRDSKAPFPSSAGVVESAGAQSLLREGPVLGMPHEGMVSLCERSKRVLKSHRSVPVSLARPRSGYLTVPAAQCLIAQIKKQWMWALDLQP